MWINTSARSDMTRTTLALIMFAVTALFLSACTPSGANAPEVVMYKTPACGCCELWAVHLENNGFSVKRENLNDLTQKKMQHGIPPHLSSCHTAVVDGYVVEGHVPADVVHRMLRDRPDIRGLSVPGMPIGSPGMEGPNPQPYEVLALMKNGSTEVFATR